MCMKNQTEKCDIYWPQKLRKTLSKSATTYYQDEKQRKTLLLISIQCECNCDKLVKYVKFEAENNIYYMKYVTFILHFPSSFWQQQVFWLELGNCFHPLLGTVFKKLQKTSHLKFCLSIIWIFRPKLFIFGYANNLI